MLHKETDFTKIAHCIERDPFSWKGVSFFYLKLSPGASVAELDVGSNSDSLAFRGKNGDYILLGKKPEGFDYPGKDARACFRVSDISVEWQQVCGVIRVMAGPVSGGGEVAAQKTDHSSHSILIVEDDPMTSQIMAQQLKKFGTVTTTSNSREATANYMVQRPDLVFLDVHYHDDKADGFDVLGSILSADNEAFIVMVSADGSLTRVLEALQRGAQGFLAKPFQATDFPYYLAKFDRVKGQR